MKILCYRCKEITKYKLGALGHRCTKCKALNKYTLLEAPYYERLDKRKNATFDITKKQFVYSTEEN